MKRGDFLLKTALSLGFSCCGVAQVRVLEELRAPFGRWLAAGAHGDLGYMQRHCDMRLDPTLLVPGAKSVVVCGVSYGGSVAAQRAVTGNEQIAPHIASYALARDYHLVLKERLHLLLKELQREVPGSTGRVFVDTAPIMEKAWAVEAGLGWVGRHSLVIHPQLGSYILLGLLVTNAKLEPNPPYRENGCGTCRACVEACPVGALSSVGERMVDASRCLSRLTIERAAEPAQSPQGPQNLQSLQNPQSPQELHGQLFGCDLCQRACPANSHAPTTALPNELTAPLSALLTLTLSELLSMSEADFTARLGTTPLSRVGLRTLQARAKQLML